MKKLIYTLSFVAVFGVAAKAQSTDTKQQEPKKVEKSPDASTLSDHSDKTPKSRMAITQKGLPASKSKNPDSKDLKAVDPKGQPTAQPATEKH